MSRSEYSDGWDEDGNWSMICWRGAVAAATRGARGQYLLRELLEALDAMPDKKLITMELESETGQHCALGVLGAHRGMNMKYLDAEDHRAVAKAFGVADALIREIVYMNDEGWGHVQPRLRWVQMRTWVAEQIRGEA